MVSSNADYKLSQAQIDHFLQHGWLKIPKCFTREQAAKATSSLWTRLGMDEHDMATWHTERTNMPSHHSFSVADFAPRAWSGIQQVLASPHTTIDPEASVWRDSFIVNLGTPAGHDTQIPPQDLRNWHVDGDFFVHYLDSPEQALLVIPLWSDIVPGGGGTMICPRAMEVVAKHLYNHPEGVSPRMTPRAQNPEFKEQGYGLEWYFEVAKSMPDDAFVEATGEVGDVYLLHPLMMHSASNNMRRAVRVITNPKVAVTEPFQFDQEDGVYNLVEQKTIKALGGERLKDWKISAERQKLVPERVKRQEEMKKKEKMRLEKLQQTTVQVEQVTAVV